ncbi:MAG: T9SS type A sorting domain-containing protein [Bacteroidota bacterium]
MMKLILPFFLSLCMVFSVAAQSDVTFSVDMAGFADAYTNVHVAGDFNGWGTDIVLSDDDGDGVFTITLPLNDGDYEYKFMVDEWAMQESLTPGDPCTLTTGEFTNRLVTVAGAADLGVVCWNSCDATCGVVQAAGMITLQVDVSEYTGSFTTVYISGQFNGWNDADNPMTDMGNGIWEVTVMMPGGDNEYKFQVDNFADDEMLASGSPCTITTGEFTNRIVTVDGDATVDAVCWGSCDACGVGPAGGMITLQVDMSEYSGAFTTVYTSGQFNGWDTAANPMTDMGNGIWEVTVMMPGGNNEYKFQVDNFADDEMLMPGMPCTVTSGEFTNRVISVDGDATVGTVCWASCEACGGVVQDSVDVTFNVNTEFITVDPAGIQLAGGADFGVPGENPMTDDDMDGIYTITVRLPMGYTGFYTFTNGACPDFSCKENIGGQDCANPDNFNDRFLEVGAEDMMINTCFEQCSTDGTCAEPATEVMVTFQVNMAEVDAIDPSGVFIGGMFEGWNGSVPMSDDDGDFIYTADVALLPGSYEFLFINGAGFAGPEMFEAFVLDTACTITTPDGAFTNRLATIEAGDTQVLPAFCFNSCDACLVDNTTNVEVDHNIFRVIPNVASADQTVRVEFDSKAIQAGQKMLNLFNAQGQNVQAVMLDGLADQHVLETAALPDGLYLVQLRIGNTIGTQRLIIQK